MHRVRRSRWAAVAALATLGVLAFVASARSEAPRPSDPAPEAPAAAPPPPPPTAPACSFVAGAWSGPIDDSGRTALFQRVSEALESPGCVDAIPASLPVTSCTERAEVVLSALFASPRFDPDRAADLLEQAAPSCTRALAVAAQGAARTSVRHVKALAALAQRDRDPDTRMVAWLALGTAEFTARAHADAAAEQLADRAIATALADAARSPDRVELHATLLEAAGNGGCLACGPEVQRAQRDPAPRVRRAATGAERFVPGAGPVARLCAALTKDAAVDVRDQAAWALRFREPGDVVVRASCLEPAARDDASEQVRATARSSLRELAR